MQERRLIVEQAAEGDIDDIAGAREPRLAARDAAAALQARLVEPAVDEAEVLATVVGLAVLMPSWPAALENGQVFPPAIAHAGQGLCEVDGGIAVVAHA